MMINFNEEAREFIESNIKLIDVEDWNSFYLKLYKLTNRGELKPSLIGTISQLLLESQINPVESLNRIPPYFLCNSQINQFICPSNVKTISKGAFLECKALTSITFNEDLQSVDYRAFAWCANLKSITLPTNLSYLDKEVFLNCISLSKVTLPSNLEEIKESTFFGCSNLTDIHIPLSITNIENGAFPHIDNLHIQYEGTKEDWKNLYNPKAFLNSNFICDCKDGIVKKNHT